MFPVLGDGGFQVMLRVVWKDRKDTKVYIQPNLSAKGNVQRQRAGVTI